MSGSSDRDRLKAWGKALRARFLKPPISGVVDGVVAGEVFGWAIDSSRPERRVHIVARVDGAVIGETLADLPRNDLVAAGKGDGKHGFRLRLAAGADGEAYSGVRIEAVGKPRNILLQNGVVSLAASQSFVLPAQGGGAQSKRQRARGGFVEKCADGVVTGWAHDATRIGSPIEVDLFAGEQYLGSAQCVIDRPDLARSPTPEARAFSFDLPPLAGDDIADRLRVRLSGDRIDLRRSKTYPGTGVEPEVASPAPAPRTDRAGVAFVICGAGPKGAISLTRASCEVHAEAGAVIDAGAPDLAAALKALVAAHETVVVLHAGQSVGADLGRLLSLPLPIDVWAVPTPGEAAPAVLAARMGRPPALLAVRGSALADEPGLLAAAVPSGDIAPLAAWAANGALRWDVLPEGSVEGGSVQAPAATPAAPPNAPPRRLTLAVWSGWSEGATPPALASLMVQCAGFDVEVLVPSDIADIGPVADLDAAHRPRSLSIKLVDTPAERGSALWCALSRAATGQVVVLCRGDAVLAAPDALPRLAAWAVSPGVGHVRPSLTTGPDETPVPVDEDGSLAAAFAVISRAVVSRAGFDGTGRHGLPGLVLADVTVRLEDGVGDLAASADRASRAA